MTDRRVVVLGGTGLFGGAAVDLLRADGMAPLVAARGRRARAARRPDLLVDAEDPSSLRAGLRAGDVVLDAAGPFQERSALLVEAALEIDCDVVDLSDALGHGLAVEALRSRIEARRIRVLTSCSSVTTLAVVLVRASGAHAPRRVSVHLAPASRVTATAGTGGALRHSLGREIRVLRGGALVPARGWRESRLFTLPAPIGRARGWLTESVIAATLPRVFPTIREADFWVDSRVPGLNVILSLLARVPALATAVLRVTERSALLPRTFGSSAGGMLVESEEGTGAVFRAAVVAPRRSYVAAVAPAVLAVRDLASGRFTGTGLVPHDRHVDPEELLACLRRLGIDCALSGP